MYEIQKKKKLVDKKMKSSFLKWIFNLPLARISTYLSLSCRVSLPKKKYLPSTDDRIETKSLLGQIFKKTPREKNREKIEKQREKVFPIQYLAEIDPCSLLLWRSTFFLFSKHVFRYFSHFFLRGEIQNYSLVRRIFNDSWFVFSPSTRFSRVAPHLNLSTQSREHWMSFEEERICKKNRRFFLTIFFTYFLFFSSTLYSYPLSTPHFFFWKQLYSLSHRNRGLSFWRERVTKRETHAS